MFLAIFDSDLARPPPFLSPFAPDADAPVAVCRAAAELDRLLADDPAAAAARLDLGGVGGFAAHAAPALVQRIGDDVVAVVSAEGDVALDAAAAAAALLDADAAGDAPALDAALAALADLAPAAWSLVAFDAASRRVLAARDAAGAAPLWWGVAPDTGLLVLTSSEADAARAGVGESSTPFPSGAVFLAAEPVPSSPGPLGFVFAGGAAPAPGRMLSFVVDASSSSSSSSEDEAAGVAHHRHHRRHYRSVRAVPRVNAGGALCGAVYRVASGAALTAGLA